MSMNKRILFMGTPDFAAAQLDALVRSGFEVIGAVTQPDKPVGRKQTLTPPPVKKLAQAHGITVYQPPTLRGDEFAALLSKLAPGLITVAAYGKILPPNVITYPEFGCINVHASLLPRWRGAAPINRAVMAGDKVTGVTIMRMDDGIDTGDMILRGEVAIADGDNYGVVHDKLAVLGGELLVQALGSIFDGTAQYTPQEGEGTYTNKLTECDGKLDFGRPAFELHNQIRGLSPDPMAYCCLRGNKIKIAESEFVPASSPDAPRVPADTPPGTVVAVGDSMLEGCVITRCDDTLTIACGRDFLKITRLLPAGKRMMCSRDFLCGRNVCAGDRLE